MIKKHLIALVLVGSSGFLKAQDTVNLSLQNAIRQAQDFSLMAERVKQSYLGGYFGNRAFWRGFYPEMNINGSIPNINRTLQPVTQPDGTEQFVQRSLNSTNVNLNVVQRIAPTGGTLTVGSTLQRIDLYGDDPSTSYLTNPVQLTLSQPIFGYNDMKWDIRLRRVMETRFEKTYQEDKERVAAETATLYFDLLEAVIMEQAALKNEAYNDTIYGISKGRFQMGKIAENELLQMELALLNSQLAAQRAAVNRSLAELALKNHLGFQGDGILMPEFPKEIPVVEVPVSKALDLALENNSRHVQWHFEQMNAQRDVAMAKAGRRPDINLMASYGRSRSADELDLAYSETESQEMVRLGFDIPIMNWGRNRSAYKAAVARQEENLADYNIALLKFQEEVVSSVQEFSMKYKELEIAARAEEIAAKRYKVSQQRFGIGKIGMTDMNIAMAEKDQARRGYIQSLRQFWASYYNIRLLTHYDFEQNALITHPTPNPNP